MTALSSNIQSDLKFTSSMHLSYIKQNRKIEKLKVAQKILHEVKYIFLKNKSALP